MAEGFLPDGGARPLITRDSGDRREVIVTRLARSLAVLAQTVTLSIVILTIISVARLLIVSNYQVPTASAVAQSLGPVSTLTGTILPLFGALLPIGTVLLVVLTFISPAFLEFSTTARLMFAATVSSLATMTVSPTPVTLAAAIDNLLTRGTALVTVLSWADYLPVGIVAGIIFLIGLVRNDIVPGFHFGRYLALTIVGTTVVTVYALVAYDAYPLAGRIGDIPDVLGRMWLPAEGITVANSPPRVGYVLSSTEVWTTILWENDRTIGLLRSDQVTARAICRLGPSDGFPLISRPTQLPIIAKCSIPSLLGGR